MKYNQSLCIKKGSLPPCPKLHLVKLGSFIITQDNPHKATLLKYFSHTRKAYTNLTPQRVEMFLREYFLTKTTLYLLYSQCAKVAFFILIICLLYETKKVLIMTFNGYKVAEKSTSRWECRTSNTPDACVRQQTESLRNHLNSFGRSVLLMLASDSR